MAEIFFIILMTLILILMISVPVLLVLNRKYRSSLIKLLESLPEDKYAQLRQDSKHGLNNFKSVLLDAIQKQVREPSYINDLITTSKYVPSDLEPLRTECELWFSRYKLVFRIVLPVFLLVCLIAICIYLINMS